MTFSVDSRLALPAGERDHRQGDLSAHLILVEYGDYECPHCAAAQPIVTAVQQSFGDDLCFVFRHFPIVGSHPHAQLAAEAAEAAGEQGLFWPMHNGLITLQPRLSRDAIVALADSVGLEVQRFEADLDTRRFEKRVSEDFMSGVRSGVNGTPSFFMNGHRYDGRVDIESMGKALQTLRTQLPTETGK